MSRGERRTLLAGAVVLLALAVFVTLRIQVSTDVGHFLPGGRLDTEVALARELAAGELSRTLVMLVRTPGREQAVQVSRELEAALRAEPRVAAALAFLEAGPPMGVEEALWSLYQPRRFAFLDAEPGDVAELTTDAGLAAAAARLRQRLASPISGLVSRVAPGDPFLILPRLLEDLSGTRAEQLTVAQGRFLTRDGTGAVLFLGTQAASFDSSAQGPFLEGVHAAFGAVDGAHGGRLELALSGAARFAVRAEQAIRADIRRVTIGSVIGLVALFTLLFRSLRLVLLTLPVLGAGFLVGTAACLLLYGQVHGLTLAFGAALIGVSIDYTVHFYCHQTHAPDPRGPRHTLARIWTGLALGAATTVLGFLALLVSTFPGLRELAVFAAFGITAALLATRAFLPGLMPAATRPSGASVRVVAAIGRGLATLEQRRGLLLGLVVAVLVLAALGVPRARWNDDIADLNRLDPDLVQEDDAVRAQVVRYEQRRLVVTVGDGEQTALEANDEVARVLEQARAAGELGGFRSLARLLPSASRQRALDTALRQQPGLWPRLERALAAEGFVSEAFVPFQQALVEPAPEPLTWADLAASPLAPLVRPFRVSLEEGVGVVSFLHELHDEDALAARLAAVPGARLIDIRGVFTRAYGAYRERMTTLLLLGLVAVLVLVGLRHRAWRPTLAACAPALLAAAGTVGLQALLGVPLNMLSLVALLMIVSMGVDYGVFLAEAGSDRDALRATLLAVLVAGLTTTLGFGLLALSAHPSLFSIGATSGLGVGLCLLLAPAVTLLVRRGERSA